MTPILLPLPALAQCLSLFPDPQPPNFCCRLAHDTSSDHVHDIVLAVACRLLGYVEGLPSTGSTALFVLGEILTEYGGDCGLPLDWGQLWIGVSSIGLDPIAHTPFF